jgi:hypothetical protein
LAMPNGLYPGNNSGGKCIIQILWTVLAMG